LRESGGDCWYLVGAIWWRGGALRELQGLEAKRVDGKSDMNRGPSRGTFVKAAACTAASSLLEIPFMNASPLNLPIGLQLYTVGQEMDSDPAGTLKRVAAVGYKTVELSPLSKTPPRDLKKMLDDTGLKNPSGHYMLPDLMSKLPEMTEQAKMFGQEFMTVTVPWVSDPSRFKPDPAQGEFALFIAIISGLTLDDWKWNAEQFNKIGEQVKKAGLQLAYHNHNFEWRKYGDVTGYDEFLRLTQPDLVKLELDCGWATVAGQDPVAYLTKYSDRYRLLHVKDFRKGFTPRTELIGKDSGAPVPTELGRGAIDYRKIFAAAAHAKIRALFVEQEPPFTEMPALEAIKIDFEYVNGLKV
jgi:sugar phosphate isomerase/epimerase